MKSVLKKNTNNLFFLFLLFVVYFKYILFVGFSPGDDTFHINYIKDNPGIIDNIVQNFLMTPARLVGGFMVGLFHPILTDNNMYFNLVSLTLWMGTGLFLKKTLKLLINKKFSDLFFLIFSFPYLCFSIFYGNLLWAYYILFLFFWSISFFSQVKYLEFKSKKYFFLYYIFFLISLFTFELIIPLLIINILLPIHYKNKKFLIKNFTIIFSLSLVFLIYKIYIVPNITNLPIYGVSSFNFISILQGLYFFYAITIENIILLFQSIKFSFNFFSLSILILLILLLKNFNHKKILNKNIILLIFILSLISNIIVFFISGYPAITYGHYNKMLVSAFFSFTFLITYFFIYFNINKWLLISFLFLIINSTYTQVNNYAKATKIKNDLLENLSKEVIKNNFNRNDIVLVNSPLFVQQNFNNEEIVFTTWDLKYAILNKTQKNLNFWLISDRLINYSSYYPVANFMNSEYLRNDSNDDIKVFYYQYENNPNNFEIFQTKIEVLKKINYLKNNPENIDKFILREKIRLEMKNMIFRLLY